MAYRSLEAYLEHTASPDVGDIHYFIIGTHLGDPTPSYHIVHVGCGRGHRQQSAFKGCSLSLIKFYNDIMGYMQIDLLQK